MCLNFKCWFVLECYVADVSCLAPFLFPRLCLPVCKIEHTTNNNLPSPCISTYFHNENVDFPFLSNFFVSVSLSLRSKNLRFPSIFSIMIHDNHYRHHQCHRHHHIIITIVPIMIQMQQVIQSRILSRSLPITPRPHLLHYFHHHHNFDDYHVSYITPRPHQLHYFHHPHHHNNYDQYHVSYIILRPYQLYYFHNRHHHNHDHFYHYLHSHLSSIIHDDYNHDLFHHHCVHASQ